MSASGASQTKLARFIVPFAGIGILALAVAAFLAMREPQMGFRSYLFAFVYWFVVPMGCMGLLMMHHLVGGWWGLPIRRLLEAGTRTLPLTAILFIPVLLGMNRIYSWIYNPGDLLTDPNFKFKMEYLTEHGFILRAVVYFVIWIGIATLLNKFSREQDASGADGTKFALRMEGMSGPGIILWAFALTFAMVDWVMSLEPKWFSTIYGMLFMVISALTGLSLVIFVLRSIADDEPTAGVVTPQVFNDLGNLMLAFTMLWAYLSFSQFLIIWAGNIKDEIPWYMSRAFGGWGALAAVLIVLHFAVPFLLLLQRGVKRRLRWLSIVTGMMLCLSAVDVYWLIVPAYEGSPQLHLTDIFAFIGIGGLWLAFYFWQLGRMPLLPLNDPRFEGALAHEHGD
ncbi:MAG: hypothetical protein WA823_04235 [Candidatus Acidiferrales bacterium]